jgi:hypothetical protein
VETHNFTQPESQPQGATWQPMTGPRGTSPTNQNDATCRALIGPPVCHVPCHLSPYLPSQPADVIHATSACATCHPYSGDTCHPLTGPTVPVVCSITCHMCHHQKLPCQLYGRTACTVSLPRGTVRTVQSPIFFACLGFRTECDIFRIRSPFDEVNIWPESGRRDGRNGVGFVGFRALSFLSLFEPCQAPGSDSGSFWTYVIIWRGPF